MQTDKAQHFREEGDRLRDAREWMAAAQAYAEYLRAEANDWPIRVQFGHCLKEAGDARGALEQYRHAELQASEDADVKLQIGHVLKILGKLEEAAKAYASALSLEPNNNDIQQNLLSILEDVEREDTSMPGIDVNLLFRKTDHEVSIKEFNPSSPLSELMPNTQRVLEVDQRSYTERSIILDISDLLNYLKTNSFPTGIQRVQLEVSFKIIKNNSNAITAFFLPEKNQWNFINSDKFEDFYKEITFCENRPKEKNSRSIFSSCVQMLCRDSYSGVFQPEDILINIGTSWGISGYQQAIVRLRRLSGVRFIQFVHDCIPILFPHFCDENTVRQYARWFSAAAFICDGFITNSNNTKNDLIRLQSRLHGHFECPVMVSQLNGNMRLLREEFSKEPDADLIPKHPYVLFVSTFEPRKDHGFVFDAWRRLLQERGEYSAPKLICVGRVGWKVGRLLALYHGDPLLRRNIILKHTVDDHSLSALYKNALFTVYNSHYEGWGLPVSESLSYGKIPVVPAHSALTEAGGNSAVYFSPGNLQSCFDAVSRLIEETTIQSSSALKPTLEADLRSWDEIASEIISSAISMAAYSAEHPETAAFQIGRLYRTRYRPSFSCSLEAVAADVACIAPGWQSPESWGIWTKGNIAELYIPFATDRPITGNIKIALALYGPPSDVELQFGVEEYNSGTQVPMYKVLISANKRSVVKLSFCLPPEQLRGIFKINISAPEAFPLGVNSPGDSREAIAALVGFMIMEDGDIGAALDFEEKLRFEEPEVAD